VSYLEQILRGAQQRGGLTDAEFSSIFQSFIPQQQQQTPNLGFTQQPIQAPQMIPLSKQDGSMGMYGKEIAALGTALGKKWNETPEEKLLEEAKEKARKDKFLEGLGLNNVGQSIKGLFDGL
jgi:hypothetical protein